MVCGYLYVSDHGTCDTGDTTHIYHEKNIIFEYVYFVAYVPSFYFYYCRITLLSYDLDTTLDKKACENTNYKSQGVWYVLQLATKQFSHIQIVVSFHRASTLDPPSPKRLNNK